MALTCDMDGTSQVSCLQYPAFISSSEDIKLMSLKLNYSYMLTLLRPYFVSLPKTIDLSLSGSVFDAIFLSSM